MHYVRRFYLGRPAKTPILFLLENTIPMTTKKLFKLLLTGFLGFYTPLLLLFSVMSLAGILPAHVNKQEYYGLQGFLSYLFFIPLFGILSTIFTWIAVAPGRKIFNITYKSLTGKPFEL